MFLQIAAGVDDDTWLSHLRRGDYSLGFAPHSCPEFPGPPLRI